MFIFKFLFILFIAFILFVVVMVASLALRFRSIIQTLINGNKQTRKQATSGYTYNPSDSFRTDGYNASQTTAHSSSQTHTGKIFAPDEGEYVEFQEIP